MCISAAVTIQLFGSWCGILLTDDSFNYLSAAASFQRSYEFRSPDGTYYVAWPPLFPVFLSMFGNPASAIIIVHIVVKTMIGTLLYFIADRVLSNKFLLLIFLTAALCGVHLTMISVFLWSELFYLLLMLAVFALAIRSRSSPRYLVPLFIAGFLLCLQRNAGILFVAGVSLWMLSDKEMPVRLRWIIPISFFLFSISGLATWVKYIHGVSDEFKFSGYRFFEDPTNNGIAILTRIGKLFLPAPAWLLVVAAVALLILSFISQRKHHFQMPEIRLMWILVSVYGLGLILLGRLDVHEIDRLISVYVPFIYLVVFISIESYVKLLPRKFAPWSVLVLLLWIAYPMARTLENCVLWHNRSCLTVLNK